MEEVASAQEAVELLLPQGDFAGALDVLNSLRATLSTHHTAGLNAFRHLPAQLADISEARTSPQSGSPRVQQMAPSLEDTQQAYYS